jgi:hypothetical protein
MPGVTTFAAIKKHKVTNVNNLKVKLKWKILNEKAVGMGIGCWENDFCQKNSKTKFCFVQVITIPPDCENTERIGNYLYTKPFCHENCKIRYIAEHCLCYYVPGNIYMSYCNQNHHLLIFIIWNLKITLRSFF